MDLEIQDLDLNDLTFAKDSDWDGCVTMEAYYPPTLVKNHKYETELKRYKNCMIIYKEDLAQYKIDIKAWEEHKEAYFLDHKRKLYEKLKKEFDEKADTTN